MMQPMISGFSEILNRDAYRYSKSGDEDTSFDFFFIHSVNLSLI